MNLKEAYCRSVELLNENGIDEADFKALCLVCGIAGIKNSEYGFNTDIPVDSDLLESKLVRLIKGEPLQYVLGKWDFFESEFYVGKGVLIPRPETEELVELAVKILKDYSAPTVIDLCSGSGCIGISIARKYKNAYVICIEKSRDAFEYLKKNATGVDNVEIINGDISECSFNGKADMIISNPPYIKSDDLPFLQKEVQSEPAMALDGGADGLDFYRIINDIWAEKLVQNGTLLLEIGNEQGESIKEILTGFNNVEVIKDIYAIDRIVKAIPR